MDYKSIRLPDNLSDAASFFMRDIIDHLEEAGTLHRLDQLTLYLLAGNVDMYLQCEEQIRAEGLVMESDRGNLSLTPYAVESKYLDTLIMGKLKDMGLTIASRTRLKLPDKEAEDTPLDRFMKESR